MLKSNLLDYNDAYIFVKGKITVPSAAVAGAAANNANKKIIFKNDAPFTDWISEINNTKIDNAKDINVVIPMYNFIEYSDNYSKRSGSLWEYYKDKSAINNNGAIVDFGAAYVTDLFNFKEKITGQIGMMEQKMLK